MSSRGIYIIANTRSEPLCRNLVYSIRTSGCHLPIVLIPFGGTPVRDSAVLAEVDQMEPGDFSSEARAFVDELPQILTRCPSGFLRRFLAFFGPFDEFIYTDNDIVALMNWEILFEMLGPNDLLNADREFATAGRYNFTDPATVEQDFGIGALERAVTAGHVVIRKSEKMISDLRAGLEWMRKHPNACKAHDQTLLHLAILNGRWKCLNLCKPPRNWLSSWAGDYDNTLALIQAIQDGNRISHLHYSGRDPGTLTAPIDELSLSAEPNAGRAHRLAWAMGKEILGWNFLSSYYQKARRRLRRAGR